MEEPKTPLKAYENPEFINSDEGRIVRMLSEYLEPKSKFQKHRILDTIVFFGSARLKDKEDAAKELARFKEIKSDEIDKYTAELRKAELGVKMSRYYEDAVELSRRLTEWSLNLETNENRFIVCTGGGPGIMEAANRGAHKAGGYSIGLNISIPFEQFINKYVTEDLSFEFHYFFMRKFWFAYLSKAFIIFPGGFGTFDEFFEVLTLIQTEKMRKKLVLVAYGQEYWEKVVNFDALIEFGLIGENDLSLFHICNDVDHAFKVITEHLTKHYLKETGKTVFEPRLNIKD